MKKVIILILLSCSNLFAQNLVPNGDFETYQSCPIAPQNFQINNWYNPSVYPSTPDYFNQCAGTVPTWVLQYQLDHSGGVGYIGIYGFITGISSGCQGCREYIQVEITESLIAGSKYCVEFYVALTEYSDIAITDLGAYLSDSSVYLIDSLNLPVVPSIENPDTILLSDTMNWMKVTGIYTAHGGERFLTIGNFRDNASSHIQTVGTTGYPFAYYLIDDVSIINCDSLFIGLSEGMGANVINLYPNPSNDVITISSNDKLTFIVIYNMVGAVILRDFSNQSKTSLSITALPKGIYFAQLTTAKGTVVKKFVKI